MHDPLIVAFEIRRPWPQRTSCSAAGQASVRWQIRLRHDHVPGCEDDPPHKDGAFPWWKSSSYSSFMRLAGRDFYWPPIITVWHREPGGHDALSVCRQAGHWRWHVHHWKLQIHPLQDLRRRLLTRCTWCGGRSRKGDVVNVSQQWHSCRGRWWQGERGLFHADCSSVSMAHKTCVCACPVLDNEGYGMCARCERRRPYGMSDEGLARARELNEIPVGRRRT